MHRIARLRRLSPHDWRLLVEAAVLVARIRVALWIFPFKKVQLRFAGRTRDSAGIQGEPVDLTVARAVGVAVRRSSRLVPAATCLPQALATRVMLERRGVANALRFGVAKSEAGVLEAHAWVEVDDVVIVGDLGDLARFHRLPDLPDGLR